MCAYLEKALFLCDVEDCDVEDNYKQTSYLFLPITILAWDLHNNVMWPRGEIQKWYYSFLFFSHFCKNGCDVEDILSGKINFFK